MERSYIDQLVELQRSVESDVCMPHSDWNQALNLIATLEDLLEKYSA